MLYFQADEKWNDLFYLVDDIDDYLLEKYEDSEKTEDAIEEFQDYVDEMERDYRYGLLDYEDALVLEFDDYVALVAESGQAQYKPSLEKKYEEMTVAYNDYIEQCEKSGKNELKLLNVFRQKRRNVMYLLRAATEEGDLVITDSSAYDLDAITHETETLAKFLEEKDVEELLGKNNVGKIRHLLQKLRETDNSEEEHEYWDEIKEVLDETFGSNGKSYEGRNKKDIEIINKLYGEIEEL